MKEIPKLSEIFNLETSDNSLQTISDNRSLEQSDDYQLARQTMRRLIIKGGDTLDELINLAKNSEHPRTYEVAGQMIKHLSDVSKDLLGLQKQIKELEATQSTQQIGTQNNVVFAGSTHELMKLLGKKDDGNTIDQ